MFDTILAAFFLALGVADDAPATAPQDLDALYDAGQDARENKDFARAHELLSTACDAGLLDACALIESMRRNGDGIDQDEDAANAELERLCERDGAIACSSLAGSYHFGTGRAVDPQAAIPYYRKACELDTRSGIACNNLGVIIRDGAGGAEPDPTATRAYFERSCELGSRYGCMNVGTGLTDGTFGTADYPAGIALLQDTCERGLAVACNFLGIKLRSDANPAPDLLAGIDAYRRACELGASTGCTNGAIALGTPAFGSDQARAKLDLAQSACELENAFGCYRAGWILHKGEILPGDPSGALASWETGCALDTKRWAALSCTIAANAYNAGPYVAINVVRDSQRAQRRRGEWREALAGSTQALAMLEALGHDENEEYALVLQQHGLNLNEAGRDVEAAEFARRSWVLTKDIQGERDPSTLNNLHNYATLLAEAGNSELAQELLGDVYEARVDVLGPTHPDTLSAAKNRAIRLRVLGRFEEAMAIFDMGVAAMADEVGPDHPYTWGWRFTRNWAVLELGRIREANATTSELMDRVRAEQGVGVDPIEVVRLQAHVYRALGLERQSSDRLRLVSEYQSDRFGRGHRDTVSAMSAYAVSFNNLGRYSEAESIQRENIAAMRSAYGDDHPRTILQISNLGFTLGFQGRGEERLAIHRQALAQRIEILGEDHPSTLFSRNALAGALVRLDQNEEALGIVADLVERKRRVIGAAHPSTIRSMRFHAQLLTTAERYEEAEPLYRATLAAETALQEEGGSYRGEANADLIDTRRGLALLLRKTGRAAEAQSLLAGLAPILDRRFGQDHSKSIGLRAELIRTQLDQPSAQSAAWASAQIIAQALNGDSANGAGAAAKSRAQRSSGAAGPETQYLDRGELSRLIADAAWAEFSSESALSGEAASIAFKAVQDAMDGPASQALASSAARRLASATGDELGLLARRREEAREELVRTDAALTQALLNRGNDGAELRTNLETRKADLNTELNAIDGRLRREAPEYFSLIDASALAGERAAELFEEDEAGLLILPTDYGTHVISITSDGLGWHRSDWTREDVRNATRRLLWDVGGNVEVSFAEADRWAQEGQGAYPYDRSTAFELYSQLIAPLADEIADKRHLFIAGAGSLSGFPLAALVTEEPEGLDGNPADLRATSWLADRFAITQMPSLQSLEFLRRFGRADTDGGAMTMRGFGDPILTGEAATRGGRGRMRSAGLNTGSARSVYSGSDRSGMRGVADVEALRDLARLPGTRTELMAIRDALDASDDTISLGEDATEQRFKASQLGDVDILVLATHGLLAGEVDGAFEPGLVFTPPMQASLEDDGFLSTSEVAELQLGADWVILSACNTAAGDGSDGAPGLSGLAKAFFFAGARNLLASHWPVRDDVAALLTVRTIEIARDRPDLSRAEALQQAMIEVRNDVRADGPQDTWAHPNAWAPFTLIGDGAN